MKTKIKRIITIVEIITTLLVLIAGTVSACTGFNYLNNGKVLVGKNMDFYDQDIYIKVYPPEGGKFGRICFEYSWPLPWDPDYMVQYAGMNDQGLWHETLFTPELPISFEPFKPLLLPNQLNFLETLSTVTEVVDYVESYNLYLIGLVGMNGAQMFFTDSTGASVIVEGDDILYKEGDFQVCTNFLQSHPDLGGYPCWRYETAISMLENLADLSVDYFRTIFNATHQEGYWDTVVTHVFDVQEKVIYLYYYHDFEKVIILDMEEEFAKGEHSYHLPSLFEPSNNQAPSDPNKPTGPSSGNAKEECSYSVLGSWDPDGKRVFYLFDWGDGTDSGWIKPGNMGRVSATHTWEEQGAYEIKAKAKDIYGKESDWSDPLSVSMTKNKVVSPLFQRFLERYPHLFPILRQILLYFE